MCVSSIIRQFFFRRGSSALPVANITTKERVGTLNLTFYNLTGVCVSPRSQASAPAQFEGAGSPPSSNAALIGGLVGGICGGVALAGAALAVLILWKRRRRRQQQVSASLHSNEPATPDSCKQDLTLPARVSPARPASSDALWKGASPRSDTLQGSLSQIMGSPGDGRGRPELWRLQKVGSLEGEHVELGPLIGQGGYGRVYKGRWQGALVAVKIVENQHTPQATPEAAQARAYRESILSSSLAHPNVVATYKICSTHPSDRPSVDALERQFIPLAATSPGALPAEGGSRHFDSAVPLPTREVVHIVMEYCDRGTLAEAIARRRFHGPPPGHKPDMPAILRCLIDIATGMQYLHSIGVLHGDLKPGNVLLKSTTTDARGFICKLADFGLSRILEEEQQTHVMTQTYGTACFMPPELLKSSRLSPATDIYSFSMVMYQIFTLKMPFEGLGIGQVFWAVAVNDQRPEVPSDCPTDFADLLRSCWASEASERPPFAEIVRRLQAMFRSFRPERPSPLGSAMSKASTSTGKASSDVGGSTGTTTPDPSDKPLPAGLAPPESPADLEDVAVQDSGGGE
eukprot:jgi/Botrbrau1/3310/Bobra.0048s0007.1